MTEEQKKMIEDEITALEKLYISDILDNKNKIFKKYTLAKSTFLICKN
jgi:hypothetical protein